MTIPEDQTAYFKVSGTHTIYLTGNYVISADSGHNHEHELYDGEDEEDDYDMSPDDDELEYDEESDELDDLEDPRITEVASEDEKEPPKLVKMDEVAKKEESVKKGKNKRAREESDDEKEGDKKVQFAKDLEQGPTSSPEAPKTESSEKTKIDSKKEEGKSKPGLGVKVVQGVKLDDKKMGTGPAAKKGSKVALRYIGKLKDGKVFDCECTLVCYGGIKC